ncbi:hypothetical protein GCM10012275_54190 [Longimycelium tulufanense]|uniref:Uncharacterized protein n=1 Tax=Longimycelium tulufanense TaxID=907463 RepID=A0A8J3CD66_9PSEU|nr:hypothetical protein [Longimycelium tulufanense]GGM76635.1 hypothetical protein GCM10012275_54190 [Longimycelium tulufanense]
MFSMFSTVFRRLRRTAPTTLTPTPVAATPDPHPEPDLPVGPECLVCENPGPGTCPGCERFVSVCEYCGDEFVGARRCCSTPCRNALGLRGTDDPWLCVCCHAEPLDRDPWWFHRAGEPYDVTRALCQCCYVCCCPERCSRAMTR